jgi:hypothetical protein
MKQISEDIYNVVFCAVTQWDPVNINVSYELLASVKMEGTIPSQYMYTYFMCHY